MMKQLILGLLLLAVPVAAQAGSNSVVGNWKGPVTQPGASKPYSVMMTLTEKGGSTFYPELQCSGVLKFLTRTEDYVFYTETITREGKDCIDGTITVSPTNKGLGWGWFGMFAGEIYSAYADLERTK